jgi:low temperature requirement protein LtrA
MRGVVVPDQEEDFTADPVELFFDLAFVFAFSRLVYHLVHHPDWAGVGEFALLFLMIWLPWTQFTWSANAVPGNQRPVRVLLLVGTVVSVPMAASVTTAFDDGGVVFALSLSVILVLGLATMYFGLPPSSAIRRSIASYSVPNLIAVVLMLGGSFLDRGIRIAVWIAALAVIVVLGMLRASGSEWLVRPGHFAERHGLIVIVALGEVIVALALPVVEALEGGDGLPGRTLTAIIAAGAFATLLWWSYFDRFNPAIEHRHEEHADDGAVSGAFARDVYSFAHIPIVAGVILCAAALEEIALHPGDVLPLSFRWMLVTGIALTVAGVAAAIVRSYRVLPRERIVAAALLGLLVAAFGGRVSGLSMLLVVDVVLALLLAAEHVRVERGGRVLPSRT